MEKKETAPRLRLETLDVRKLKLVFFWVFALGLTAHGYRFMNPNFNHDSLYSLYEQGPELMISVGRFLRPVYRLLRGNLTLPAFGGILALVYLSFASYLLVELLDIQNSWLIGLVCGVLTVNSTMSLMNATYMTDTDAYCLSFLLAVLGVWALKRWKHGSLLLVLFCFLSLGIYQAYVSTAVFLLLLLGLEDLLRGKPIKQVYGRLIKEMLLVLASIICYYVVMKLTQRLSYVQEADIYNTVSSLPPLSVREVLHRIRACIVSGAMWSVLPIGPVAHNQWLIRILNVMMGALAVLCLLSIMRRRGLKAGSVWGIVGIVAAMPFGLNVSTLISGLYHWLTMYSMNLLYLMVLVLVQMSDGDRGTRVKRMVWAVMAAVMVYDGCLCANELYLKKEMESEATLSTFTRIIDRMENTPDFNPRSTRVAMVGEMIYSPLSEQRPGIANDATGMWFNFSVSYYDTCVAYLTYYLGYPAECVSEEEVIALEKDPRVMEMPPFPAQGSVRMVDDVMVVKLAEPVEETEE